MYRRGKDEVLAYYNVDETKGLGEYQVQQSRMRHGTNVLEEGHKKRIYEMIIDELKEVMVIILLIAMAISLFLGEYLDALVIAMVILINTSIGVMQENKAEKALEALKHMAAPKALVLRNGEHIEINTDDIVVGDIIILEAGRIVPCDMRLLTSVKLQIDEAILTGESVAVNKNADVCYDKELPIGDQHNMAFMSTFVTSGRGSGICVNTGMNSEVGKIARMLNDNSSTPTPLQQRLSKLGKTLGFVCVAVCIGMVIIGLFQKRDLLYMIMSAISLAVAAIPEGLAAIVTIVLAIGVQRMSKQSAIVRTLHSVETLGCTGIICSDKTGTLTQNKMKVVSTYADMCVGECTPLLVRGMVLCNDTICESELIGEAMEVALCEFGEVNNVMKKQMDFEYPRVDEIPFNSDRKMMCTVHQEHKGYTCYVKGAIDRLLNLCTHVRIGNEVKILSSTDKELIAKAATIASERAERVLALAYKENVKLNSSYESNLVFVGFVGMIDPPRKEVKQSISDAHDAGIKVVMITGDHPITAKAIAKELGIMKYDYEVLSGSELDAMSDYDLRNEVMHYSVYARVSPNHKVRLVKAYQANGNVVAMSGDGVNDAPSLKSADIGVAMGKSGSDVAKNAADLILVDDNFTSIVRAIEEGRNIYLNIQKSILFLLSCNFGEVATIFLALLFLPTFPSPLTPIQILWVNLITDSFPSLSLGVNPKSKDVMKQKPRKSDEPIITSQQWLYIVFNGLIIGAMSLVAFRVGVTESEAVGQTMAFMVLSITQLFHSFNLLHYRKTTFETGLFHNKYLVITFIIGVIIQIGVTKIPFLQTMLKTVDLSLIHWAIVFGLAIIIVLINDLSKLLGREEEF